MCNRLIQVNVMENGFQLGVVDCQEVSLGRGLGQGVAVVILPEV